MSDKNGTGQDGRYCYPNSDVLINKLGLRDKRALEAAEVALTLERIEQYEPNGSRSDTDLIALLRAHPVGDTVADRGKESSKQRSRSSSGD
jgi:fido (protein-threonine AMPylation protein)